MNIRVFLAIRNLTRTKRSVLLLVALAIVIALLQAVNVVNTNVLEHNVIDAEIRYGRWHLAYYAFDPEIIPQIESSRNVAKASFGYRLRPQVLCDSNMRLELQLFQQDKIKDFTPALVQGHYPQDQGEILVPDWYLRCKDIDTLPARLETVDFTFTITGAYIGRAADIKTDSMQAFGTIEANPSLLDPELLLADPSSQNLVSQLDSGADQPKSFVYIQMVPGAAVNKTVYELDSITGLYKFAYSDYLVGENRVTSPEYNTALLAGEGRCGIDNPSWQKEVRIQKSIPLIISGILVLVLLTMVYVSANLVVNNRVRSLGLMAAVGLEPAKIRDAALLELFLLGLVALPLGTGVGTVSAAIILQKTLGQVYGTVLLPYKKIIFNGLVAMLALILAALLPARKAARLSPLTAINQLPGDKRTREIASPLISLQLRTGVHAFAILYSLKNLFKHFFRFLGIVLIISLLLAAFIPLTAEIERRWNVGSWRKPYQPHYSIITHLHRDHRHVELLPITEEFLAGLANIDTVANIYFQHSVANSLRVDGECMYEWRLDNDQLTLWGSRVLNLSAPTRRNGYPGYSFIFGGVSGYGADELNLAAEYLIEGSIDIDKMAEEPIILLPKYIVWSDNADLPYTNLAVGDSITLVEWKCVDGDLTLINEYTFTIGGFLSTLLFRQVAGASSGFVGMMHVNQLEKLATPNKGIMEIYVDDKDGANSYQQIRQLCFEAGFGFTQHKDDFALAEQQAEDRLFQLSLYTVFGVLGLILFMAMFNLVISDILARKREFALLYALGLENRQIKIIVLTEALCYGVLGIAFGLAAGLVIIFKNYTPDQLLNRGQMIPWTHIGVGSGLILLAGVVAGIVGLRLVLNNTSVQAIHPE